MTREEGHVQTIRQRYQRVQLVFLCLEFFACDAASTVLKRKVSCMTGVYVASGSEADVQWEGSTSKSDIIRGEIRDEAISRFGHSAVFPTVQRMM